MAWFPAMPRVAGVASQIAPERSADRQLEFVAAFAILSVSNTLKIIQVVGGI